MAEVLGDVLAELEAYDGHPEAEWGVSKVRNGSVVLMAGSTNPDSHAMTLLIDGVKDLGRNSDAAPVGWSRKALNSLSQWPRGCTAELRQANTRVAKFRCMITSSEAQRAGRLAKVAPTKSIGGVVGTLDRLQQVGKMSAQVIEQLSGRAVPVIYPDRLLGVVGANWGNVVRVDGDVWRDGEGRAKQVVAERIEPVIAGGCLSDLIGLFADDPEFDPAEVLEFNRG